MIETASKNYPYLIYFSRQGKGERLRVSKSDFFERSRNK